MKDKKGQQLCFDFIPDRERAYEEIYGTVTKIIYENPNTNWKVIEVILENNTQKKVAGFLPNIQQKDIIHARCTITEHPKFGEFCQIDEFYKELPYQREGIMRFMISMIEGVGEHIAEHIVDRFKERTLKILEEEPERLLEIDGINEKLLLRIKTSTEKIDSVVKELVLLGFSPKWASRIYLKYGKDAAENVKSKPYRLIKDFKGIGFKKAEVIAKHTGIDDLDEDRIKAAIFFSIQTTLKKTGHNFLYLHDLVNIVSRLLDLPKEFTEAEVLSQPDLIIEENRVYLKVHNRAEKQIAKKVSEKLALGVLKINDITNTLQKIETEISMVFSQQQKEAITTAIQQPITIITGAAGTGKTTLCIGLLKVLDELGSTYKLCAPTGKAANKLKSLTDHTAYTIHRLLEYAPSIGYRINESNPLQIDYLVVDEASMVDLLLLKALMEGISKTTRIIFIGDPHQLPPVEAGNSLQALLGSFSVSQIFLPDVFRQQKESTILKNASLVNLEQTFPLDATEDFIFHDISVPEKMIEKLYASIEKLKSEGFHPIKDINILTPLNKGGGDISVSNLNVRLMEYLNPRTQDNTFYVHDRELRINDKVMQRKNDYDLELYNGDIGFVLENDDTHKNVIIEFFGEKKEIPYSKMDNIVHNYAMTVHKAQGSESRAVIFLATKAGCYFLLNKNLFYTAITRAKEKLVMIMPKEVVKMAVRYNIHRNSHLSKRIQELVIGHEEIK